MASHAFLIGHAGRGAAVDATAYLYIKFNGLMCVFQFKYVSRVQIFLSFNYSIQLGPFSLRYIIRRKWEISLRQQEPSRLNILD